MHYLQIVIVMLMSFGIGIKSCLANCFDDCQSQNELYANYDHPPCNYYGGISYIQSRMAANGEWNRFFVTSHPGFSFYFGRRLNPLFSVELGYEWYSNRPKKFPFLIGETVLGFPNLTNRNLVVTSKARLKTGYLDLQLHLPLWFDDFCYSIQPEFLALVGVSSTKPKMHIRLAHLDRHHHHHHHHHQSTLRPHPFVTHEELRHEHLVRRITFVQGRTRALYRLGLGLQGFIYNNLGLRFMYRFQNTSALRPRLVATPELRQIFKDSQSVSLGFYTTFPAF